MFPAASPQRLNLRTALQDEPTSPSVTTHANTQPEQTALSNSPMRVGSSPSWFSTQVEGGGGSFSYPDVLDSLSGEPHLANTCHINPNYDATNVNSNLGFSPLSPQYIGTSEVTCSSSSTPGDNTPSTFSSKNAFSSALSRVDCDLRLSKLSVDLCQQAQRNMAADQQSDRAQTGADLTEAETGSQHLSGDVDTTGQSREFGDALCSTSEFMAIIQSKANDIGLDDLTTKHEAHSPLINLSCVLNLISCYLLTVAVFEKLVRRLHEHMACSGNETPSSDSSQASHSAGLQILPGLHLANFHVRQSNLQTKILIQIVEHQFEMIEKSLGLPVELRVSSDSRVSFEGGLLQNGLDEGLLEAVLTRLCPMSGSLASLRENIMKVRRLVAT